MILKKYTFCSLGFHSILEKNGVTTINLGGCQVDEYMFIFHSKKAAEWWHNYVKNHSCWGASDLKEEKI